MTRCPAGGRHQWRYHTAAQCEDDSGRRWVGGWECNNCGAFTSEKPKR